MSKLGQFSLQELEDKYVNWIQTPAVDRETVKKEQCQLKGKVSLFVGF